MEPIMVLHIYADGPYQSFATLDLLVDQKLGLLLTLAAPAVIIYVMLL